MSHCSLNPNDLKYNVDACTNFFKLQSTKFFFQLLSSNNVLHVYLSLAHCSLSSCFNRVISFHDQRERVLASLLFHPNHHIQASNTHEYLNTFPLSPFSFWLKVCITKTISLGNIYIIVKIYIEHLARLLSLCNCLSFNVIIPLQPVQFQKEYV